MSKFFKEIYDSWKDVQQEKYDAIKDIIDTLNGRILDVGCGKAWLEKYFKKEFVCFDKCKEYLKHASTRYKILGDADSMPFKDEVFDAIIAINVVHLLRNPLELIRVTKKNGKIVILTHKITKNLIHLLKKLKILEYRFLKNPETSYIYICKKLSVAPFDKH